MISRRRFLEILGTSTTVGSPEAPTHEGTATKTASDRLIGAHYYTWYGPANHWSNGYTGEPTLGEYDSQDSTVIMQHVDWAATSGIDWFNTTWWGPDSYSGRTLENHVAPVLAGTDVEFSVLYEPNGRFDDNESGVDFDDRTNRERLAADLEHIAAELVTTPNYLHIDGNPVLYVYIAHTFTGDVTGAFRDAQTQAGTEFYLIGDYGRTAQLPAPIFDAVSPYNMYRPVEAVTDGFANDVAHAYEGWSRLSQEADFDFIPLVLPGFDNTAAAGVPDGQPVLHRSPERYRDLCTIARRYMSDAREMALITSFNEWHEYTSIEPGETFGTTYLHITNEHLAGGESLPSTRHLVPLTFHWQNYVRESAVNPDVPEGSGRRLTIALDTLRFMDRTGSNVETYDIGGSDEPVITHGVSGAEAHGGRTWRWCTANRLMTSTLYVPAAVAAATKRVTFVCRALDDGFGFTLALGESTTPTTVSASRGWNEVTTELRGQMTTGTETRSSTETELQSSSIDRDTTTPPPTSRPPTSLSGAADQGTTKPSTTTPGFGIGTSLTAAGIGAGYAAYRRFTSTDTNTDE